MNITFVRKIATSKTMIVLCTDLDHTERRWEPMSIAWSEFSLSKITGVGHLCLVLGIKERKLDFLE